MTRSGTWPTDEDREARLEALEARLAALESAAADPWQGSPVSLDPPAPKPALAGPTLLPRAGPIVVTVAKTAGVSGNAATQCSYVYTVTDLAGNQCGTEMTPEQARTDVGAYYYAGEGDRSDLGLAMKVAGVWKLLVAFGEVPKTSVCP